MKFPKIVFSSLSLILCLLLLSNFIQTPIQASQSSRLYAYNWTDSISGKALAVLEKRCNVCHRKQNPFKIFKEKNLEKYAPLIYQQVFEYKRMPKDGTKLTEAEKQALLDLIATVNYK